VNEMLFIRELKPTLNEQSDSVRAKVFGGIVVISVEHYMLISFYILLQSL